MPKDLLFFKPSAPTAITHSQHRIPKTTRLPSYDTQSQRLPVMFRELQRAIDSRNLQTQRDTEGVEPDFVLVFEVANGIENFNRAAVRAGLEWLRCEESEGEPDEEFYVTDSNGDRTEKKVPQKIYLTMSNHQALENLFSLWEIYCRRRDHKLPRNYGAFAHLFAQLRNIRKWGKDDRYSNGVLNAWNKALESNPESITFEIELWYRNTSAKRDASEAKVREIIENSGGSVVKVVRYDEIQYHAILAKVPASVVRNMVDHNDTELINEDQIMWFRATGQAITVSSEFEITEDAESHTVEQLGPPIIALLDGLPLTKHVLIDNRVIIDDPDSFEDDYPSEKRVHGTSMASLIINGDLGDPHPQHLTSLLYVRPIMRYKGAINSNTEEYVPNDELFVDIIHRAVLRIKSLSETQSVRIINLSIGCADRPFDFTMSPEAKMLDYLSDKYNLLFIVSVGNSCDWLISDSITVNDYSRMSLEQRAKIFYNNIWSRRVDHRIISPSESINALTIGALHADYSDRPESFFLFNPLPDGLPAFYGRFGGGRGRSAKPEAIVAGGKAYLTTSRFGDSTLEMKRSDPNSLGPGQKIASPNSLTSTAYTFGTSNSAALTSRMCAQLLENLRGYKMIPSDYEAISAKCMFVHACKWGDLGRVLKNNYVPNHSGKANENVKKWIGYGSPELERSLFCNNQRVTLIGYGSIEQDKYVVFRFPLPKCLQAQSVEKKLTITLAWNSPINVRTQKYRLAGLEFTSNIKNIDLVDGRRTEVDNTMSKRGTVQHEVFRGKTASTFDDGTDLVINVLCKKEPQLTSPIKFVLMVTLEVAPETQLPIYQEVEARIKTHVQVGI